MYIQLPNLYKEINSGNDRREWTLNVKYEEVKGESRNYKVIGEWGLAAFVLYRISLPHHNKAQDEQWGEHCMEGKENGGGRWVWIIKCIESNQLVSHNPGLLRSYCIWFSVYVCTEEKSLKFYFLWRSWAKCCCFWVSVPQVNHQYWYFEYFVWWCKENIVLDRFLCLLINSTVLVCKMTSYFFLSVKTYVWTALYLCRKIITSSPVFTGF